VEPLLWRIRVAVPWVIVAVGMSAGTLLGLASPGTLGEVTAGRLGDMEITAGLLILLALFWFVPLAMAFLTLVLRDPVINRYANAGVGVVVTGMWARDLIEHLVVGGGEFSGGPLVALATIVAGLAILWHAWKWPKVHYEEPLVEEVTSMTRGPYAGRLDRGEPLADPTRAGVEGCAMRRWIVLGWVAAAVAGIFVVAPRSKGAPGKGWRRAFWTAWVGVPTGRLGRFGARVLAMRHSFYAAMAGELALQPDDDLLDVGCGSAGLLTEQASHVRYVAGLDLSEIQLGMARQRLADRIAAGTAEIVMGDAMALPWEDGRFSVVASLNCVKFIPDPQQALREMYRVLRPGGRAVLTLDQRIRDQDESGKVDAWGQWQWSDAGARRLMEGAGFVDVALSVLSVVTKEQLVRGTKPAGIAAGR